MSNPKTKAGQAARTTYHDTQAPHLGENWDEVAAAAIEAARPDPTEDERAHCKNALFEQHQLHDELDGAQRHEVVNLLLRERAAARAEDPMFASDATRDVDYWRLKAREHWEAFQGCHETLLELQSKYDELRAAARDIEQALENEGPYLPAQYRLRALLAQEDT